MREIKFRVWDQDDNKIYKVDGFINNFPFVDWGYDNDFEEYSIQDHYLVKNGEIMQYTGLKDKKGKEIYEGDILNDGYYNYQVYYDEDEARFTVDGFYDSFQDVAHDIFSECAYKSMNIIGNRFENPELLKEVE